MFGPKRATAAVLSCALILGGFPSRAAVLERVVVGDFSAPAPAPAMPSSLPLMTPVLTVLPAGITLLPAAAPSLAALPAPAAAAPSIAALPAPALARAAGPAAIDGLRVLSAPDVRPDSGRAVDGSLFISAADLVTVPNLH